MFNFDYRKLCEIRKMIVDMDNDFDVLEGMSEMLESLSAQASLATDAGKRYAYVVDDTTNYYLTQLIEDATKLHELFDTLCEEFGGISEAQRATAIELLDSYLVSSGLILYKVVGYEVVANHLATGNKGFANLTLPPALIGKDDSEMIETLEAILNSFKENKAYFAEYQVGNSEVLDEIMNQLESSSDPLGTLKIAQLDPNATARKVNKIVSDGYAETDK